MQPLDLGLLVQLDALLQEGSVIGAARRMGLSTPEMSHALARIRKRLDAPVLVRSGRGMLLNPALAPSKTAFACWSTRHVKPWNLRGPSSLPNFRERAGAVLRTEE